MYYRCFHHGKQSYHDHRFRRYRLLVVYNLGTFGMMIIVRRCMLAFRQARFSLFPRLLWLPLWLSLLLARFIMVYVFILSRRRRLDTVTVVIVHRVRQMGRASGPRRGSTGKQLLVAPPPAPILVTILPPYDNRSTVHHPIDKTLDGVERVH
jgi:hypothetical protein